MKYVERPVIVDAVQFDPTAPLPPDVTKHEAYHPSNCDRWYGGDLDGMNYDANRFCTCGKTPYYWKHRLCVGSLFPGDWLVTDAMGRITIVPDKEFRVRFALLVTRTAPTYIRDIDLDDCDVSANNAPALSN